MWEQVVTWLHQYSVWLQNHEVLTNALRNVATTLGIVLGGGFAFYKFVLEGSFSRRLQPNMYLL
jgi:hypothetical protein